MPYAKLRGKIKERYNTVAAFAEAIHMSRYQIDSRLANKTAFSIEEMLIVARALEITDEELPMYFFYEITRENASA